MKFATMLLILAATATAAIRVDVYPAAPRTDAIEYDIVVPPGHDPTAIVLRFDGTPTLDPNGDLLVARRNGSVFRHSAPVTYQIRDGLRTFVESRFRVRANGSVGFEIGEYDRGHELVIDPVVTHTERFNQRFLTIAAERNTGNVFLKSETQLVKMDPNGAILSATVPLNGAVTKFDAMALDGAGNLYFATAGNCPAGTPSAGVAPGGDIVVGKLNPDLITAAYLFCVRPGPSTIVLSAAVDSAGALYVTGGSTSDIFPATAVFGSIVSGSRHMFAFKVSPAGDSLPYSIVTGNDAAGLAIALDSAGNAYVAGVTGPGFEPRQAFQPQFGGGLTDGFLLKIAANGANLPFATFLNGTHASGVVVDPSGKPVVSVESANLPLVGPFAGANGAPLGQSDAYVAKFTADGQQVLLGTFVPGTSGGSTALGISASDIYVTGVTGAPGTNGLSEVNGIALPASSAPQAFAVRMDQQFQRVLSTRLPSNRLDHPEQIVPTKLGFIAAGDSRAPDTWLSFVSEQADLGVSLLRAPATQQRVEVSNFGQENATGVRLTALFLNNTITGVSVPCTVLSAAGRSSLECALGTLFKGGTVTVVVNLANPATGSFNVSSGLIDPNSGNNRP
ncbi:MAG: hypothetical protein R2762_04705 [Bryobacteraceae bacterium]